jgi:hypothetical protein
MMWYLNSIKALLVKIVFTFSEKLTLLICFGRKQLLTIEEIQFGPFQRNLIFGFFE